MGQRAGPGVVAVASGRGAGLWWSRDQPPTNPPEPPLLLTRCYVVRVTQNFASAFKISDLGHFRWTKVASIADEVIRMLGLAQYTGTLASQGGNDTR